MSNIAFQPSTGRVLIKDIKENSTDIDVATPEDIRTTKGKIVAMGPLPLHQSGAVLNPVFKLKDVVLYKVYGADSLYISGEKHFVVTFENIVGVLNEK